MTMGGGNSANLPQIGAVAVIAGMQQFTSSANQISSIFNQLNDVTKNYVRNTNKYYGDSQRTLNNYVTNHVNNVQHMSFATILAAEVVASGVERMVGAFVKGAASMVDAGASFEHALNPVRVITDATDRQMQQLGDQALELTRNFNTNAASVGTLAKELAQGGLSFKDIQQGGLQGAEALQIFSAGALDASQSADLMAKTLKAYKMPGTEATHVAEILGGAAKESAGGFNDFSNALKTLLPLGAQLKIPFDDLAATITVMTNAGLTGEQVGTNLRQLFLRMIEPTQQAAAVMQKYNIGLFDAQGRFVGMKDVLMQLDRAFGDHVVASGKVTEEERAQALAALGMSRAITGALALIQQTPAAFEQAHRAMDQFAGSQVLSEFQRDTTSQLGILKNQVIAFATVFDQPLNEIIRGGLETANQFLRDNFKLDDIRKDAEAFVKFVGDTFAQLQFPDFEPVLKGAADLIAIFTGGGPTVKGAVTDFNNVTKAINGVLLVIGTLEEAAATALSGFAKSITGGGNTAMLFAQDVQEVVQQVIKYVAMFVAGLVTAGKVVGAVLSSVSYNFSQVGTFIGNVFKSMGDNSNLFAKIGKEAFELWAKSLDLTYKGVRLFVNGVAELLRYLIPVVGQLDKAFLMLESTFGRTVAKLADPGSALGKIAASVIPGFGLLQSAGAAAQAGKQSDAIDAALVDHDAKWRAAADAIPNAVEGIFKSAEGTVEDFKSIIAGVPGAFDTINIDVQKFFNDALDAAKKGLPSLDAWVAKFRASVEKAKQEVSGVDIARGKNDSESLTIDTTQGATSEHGPGVPPETFAQRQLDTIRKLTAAIPLMTEEMAKYIEQLTKADESRLQPIVDALMSQRDAIQAIGEARRDYLATEIKIAQIDDKLAQLGIQRKTLELASQAATLPYEQRILELKGNEIAVERQMLPLQNAIADIDKQIAMAQQEDLNLRMAGLRVQQAMLPLQNAIADIDKAIALTQLQRYDLQLKIAQIDKQELPVKNKIADLQQKVQDNNKEDWNQRINILKLQQQELPARQAIAAIEEKINNLIDERQALLDKRAQLVAEGDAARIQKNIKTVSSQLDDLWARFGITKGSERSALIPQIIDLEKQKKGFEDALKPAETLVDKLKEQQEETDRNNEIAKIDLELQEQQYKKLIKPIEDQIKAQNDLADARKINADLANAYLEQEIQRQQTILEGLERSKTAIERQQQAIEIDNEIIRLGLEMQKSKLEALLRSWQDQLDVINRTKESQAIQSQIAVTFLEEQKKRLQDQLIPLQNIKDAIDRQIQTLQLQTEQAKNSYDQQILKIQAIQLANEQYKNTLEGTRLAEQSRLNGLVQGFTNALTQSGAFSQKEAEEVPKRLGLWDSENTKLDSMNTQYKNLTDKLGVTTAWSNLSTAITGAGGTVGALQSARTNVDDVTTAITGVNGLNASLGYLAANKNPSLTGPGSLAGNLDLSEESANNLRDALASNPSTTHAGGIYNALSNLMGGISYFVTQYVGYLNNALSGTNISIAYHADLAKDSFNNLTASIQQAGQAYANFSAGVIKSIATQAAANAAATGLFNFYRGQGYSFGPSAQYTYNDLLGYLNNKVIGYADGGMVPGPRGQAQLATVHGGELVIPANMVTPTLANAVTGSYNVTNYNFSANYQRQQDPITASMDMRSIIALTR